MDDAAKIRALAAIAGALIEAIGMGSKNDSRLRNDQAPAFDYDAFETLALDLVAVVGNMVKG